MRTVSRTDALGWALVVVITATVTATSLWVSLEMYHQFETGWSWDLAFYNQWCWAITHGDGLLSVRPIAAYATEGPSVWKTNYLSPARYAILPLYYHWPSPVTLLVIYGLVRHESGSMLAGLLALPLVLLTPMVIPLALNDFRELQLGLPFALWAVDGVRGRSKPLTILGVLGLLACRQEFGLWVAMLALVPARRPEAIDRSLRWCAWLWFTGLGWLFVAFFGFLVSMAGWTVPRQYLKQFQGVGLSLFEILNAALAIFALGLGSWGVLGLVVPRMAILTLPWLWSLANGRFGMHQLATSEWHHVRYTVPFLAWGLVAGLIGWSRGWQWAAHTHRTRLWRGLLVASTVALMFPPFWFVQSKFQRVPRPIAAPDVEPTWCCIEQVQPGDAVLAHYDLTAPLSSRRLLYSYILDQNKPKGYPKNLPEPIRWVFIHPGNIIPQILIDQGFTPAYNGQTVQVFRR